MMIIDVYELIGQRALVSRGVARRIGSAVLERLENDSVTEPLALDFTRVEAASPSFFDELVATMGELLGESKAGSRNTVIFLHPPESVHYTFQAIGRGRGIFFAETAPGCWEIELTTIVRN